MTGLSNHTPVRPGWTCRGCCEAWPCETRRRELVAEYADNHTSLIAYLVAQLVTACAELPFAVAGDLHQRFLGWAPGPRRPSIYAGRAPIEPEAQS